MSKQSYSGANVEFTDTVAQFIDSTNKVIADMATVVVTTAQVLQPNTSNGGMTSGNAHIEGIFSANTVSVSNKLRGGSVSQSGMLTITSNTTIDQDNSNSTFNISANTNNMNINANNVTYSSNTTFNGATKKFTINTANTSINGTLFSVNANTSINASSVTVKSADVYFANNNSFLVSSNTVNINSKNSIIGGSNTDILTVKSDTKIESNLDVDGTSNVDGAATFANNVLVVGTTDLYSTLDVLGKTTLFADLDLQDNNKILLGNNDVVSIYSDGINGYIESSANNFTISTNNFNLTSANALKKFVTSSGDSIKLYHNNLEKIATTINGIEITGLTDTDTLLVSGTSNLTGASTFANTVNVAGAVSLASTLNVSKASMFANTVNIAGAATLSSTLDVVGAISSVGSVTVTNPTISTTPATGALVVTGGVGIGGKLNVANTSIFNSNVDTLAGFNANTVTVSGVLSANAPVTINSTLSAGNTSLANTSINGQLTVSSSTNIIGLFTASANSNFDGIASFNNSSNFSGAVAVITATDSTTPATGALVVTGGVGIGGKLNVANTVVVSNLLTASSLSVPGVSTLTGPVMVSNTATISGATTIASTLTVSKAASFANTVNIAGDTTLAKLTTSNATVTGNTSVVNITTSGFANITNNTHASSVSSAALAISGGVGIADNLIVGSGAVFQQNVNVAGNLTVLGSTTFSSNTALSLNQSYIQQLSVLQTLNMNSLARVTSDFIPLANTFNLGSASAKWGTVYADNLVGNVQWSSVQSKPSPIITLSGGVTGTVTLASLASGNLTATVVDNGHNHIPSNITGIDEYIQDTVSSFVYPGQGVTTVYDDAANSLTITSVDTLNLVTARGNITTNAITVGDFTSSGLSTLNNLSVKSNNVLLNSDYAGALPIENVGFEVNRGTAGNKSLIWDEANDRWTIGSETFVAGTIIGAVAGNSSTATKLATERTIAISGDVVGSASFDGSANISISTTIQPNSVILGTDTTGNYIATIAPGSGISVTGSGSENAAVTISSTDTFNDVVSRGAVTLLPVSVGDMVVTGNLTVSGTTTTIAATTISVSDKNIELGSIATPTDTTANGGGITLKGSTDKTLNWIAASGAWTSSEDIMLASGKQYSINGFPVLSQTTLGTGVLNSSLTSVGTLSSGTWNATTIAANKGGTGQTSYTNGQILIGNTTGNTLTKATLTQGQNIVITNGAGAITISAANTNLSYASSASTGTIISSTGSNATMPAHTTGVAGLITDGVQTIYGAKTFSSPIIGSLIGNADTSTNSSAAATLTNSYKVVVVPVATASSINYLEVHGSDAASPVTMITNGTDTNIGLTISTKGTGAIIIDGGPGNVQIKPMSAKLRIWDDTSTQYYSVDMGDLTLNRTLTLPDGDVTLVAGTMATTSGALDQFASTTSAQLKSKISDGTGTGALVFAISPAFTGTPTAPTAAININTTQVATTAYVKAQIANDSPTKTGVGATGSWPIAITGNSDTVTNGMYLTGDQTVAGIKTFSSQPSVPSLLVNGRQISASSLFFNDIRVGGTTVDINYHGYSISDRFSFIGNSVDSGIHDATLGNFVIRYTPSDGVVYLNHQGIAKFYTTPGGAAAVGDLTATGGVYATSDVRLKENVSTINNSLVKVSKIRGVNYTMTETGKKSIGVIAQEIEEIIPEVVNTDKDGYKSVSYGNLVGLLIEAIKELKFEIDELKGVK